MKEAVEKEGAPLADAEANARDERAKQREYWEKYLKIIRDGPIAHHSPLGRVNLMDTARTPVAYPAITNPIFTAKAQNLRDYLVGVQRIATDIEREFGVEVHVTAIRSTRTDDDGTTHGTHHFSAQVHHGV